MFHVALYEPEIPPNTGNIIRLCANTPTQLHLIHPLAFKLDDKQLRRAGLDYHEWADIHEYPNYESFQESMGARRVFGCTTKATQGYHSIEYKPEDVFLFGPETRGLPKSILTQLGSANLIKTPMLSHSRSLNLSNAVSIIIFEAWRQINFSLSVI